MAKSRFQTKGDFRNLSAADMLKFIAHHRGGTGRQCKNMAMQWLQAEEARKRAAGLPEPVSLPLCDICGETVTDGHTDIVTGDFRCRDCIPF